MSKAKIILINGAGRGKSFLASILAKEYLRNGIECQVEHVASQQEAESLTPPASGYLIIVTNTVLMMEEIWQTITVEGGYLLPAA